MERVDNKERVEFKGGGAVFYHGIPYILFKDPS